MRCRWCYEEGHNQRTCKAKTEAYAKAVERRPDCGYTKQRYQERVKPTKRTLSATRCGYCQKQGHTRRKCEILQGDIAFAIKNYQDRILVAAEWLHRTPVGLGSMFGQMSTSYYPVKKSEVSHFIVTDFVVLPNLSRKLYITGKTSPFGTEGRTLSVDIRKYVKHPDYQKNSTWAPYVVSASKVEFDIDAWVARELSKSEERARALFTRTGTKRNDQRQYEFQIHDQHIEDFEAAPADHYDLSRMEKRAKQYSYESLRAEALADFETTDA